MRAIVVCVIGCLACGDNVRRDDVFAAASGSRLALQMYRYADGTEQPEPYEYFDKQVSSLCRPQPWIDGVVRCVPVAEDAVFLDATCTAAVGRGVMIEKPTHFVGRDRVGTQLVPARIYSVVEETLAIAEYYERQDGACVGPLPSPPDGIVYYTLGDELGIEPVAVREGELGEGRLGLRVRESDDGMRVRFGVRDRDLSIDCSPTLQPDGGVTCEPTEVALAEVFRDPDCGEPAILVDEAAIPAIAAVTEASGCASYHAVGGELSPPLYRRIGEACVSITVQPNQRVFAVGAPLELMAMERTVEEIPERRLQRITLGDGELRFLDHRLFDTATRSDCERATTDDVTRCIPADAAIASTLYTTGCAVEVRVAELPQQTCRRATFATSTVETGIAVHAIGDRVSTTLHHFDTGQCRPYSPLGTQLRSLGPAIDPTAFMGALYFGAR